MSLPDLGFKHTSAGAHASRTLMLSEVGLLLGCFAGEEPTQAAFREAVIEQNGLGKRSASTRVLTWKHLVDLYGVNPNQLVFRGMRWFWERDHGGRPLLALSAALSRDGLLATAAPQIWALQPGAIASRERLETFVAAKFPGRFSPATLKSIAQNINASLTQSGHLSGRARKLREQATPTAGSVAYALLLGYASGARGAELFQTRYMKAQDVPVPDCLAMAEGAARQGWLTFKRVGDIIEVDFPQLIRAGEREAMREQT